MILGCPACGKQYRIDPARLQGTRRLRCAACGLVFDRESAGAAAPAAPPRTGASSAPPGPSGTGSGEGAGPARGSRLALVADEPREFRDLVQGTLEQLGCRVETTEDGEKAFRFVAARRPVLVVLNVYLKRLLGVAVCEGIKGSPDLRATRVALVGTVFKSNRFVRAPGHLYGADDYFEDVIPPADLRSRLERLVAGPAGMKAPGAGAAAPRRPEELDAAEDAALAGLGAGVVEAPEPPDSEAIDPRAEIRRLARIMVSDLKMYYPGEFRQALLRRAFSESFREELSQAKDLIGRRFPDLPDRMEILASSLKEGLAHEREAAEAAAADE